MNEQLTIYDFLDIPDFSKLPYFDDSTWDFIDVKTCDNYEKVFPFLPLYLVHIKEFRSPLFYESMICINLGFWHALQGWGIDCKDVVSYSLIDGFTLHDIKGKYFNKGVHRNEVSDFVNLSDQEIFLKLYSRWNNNIE